MPTKLTQLEDDPYRSLAGLVRTSGGYAKDEALVFRVFVGRLFPLAHPRTPDQADRQSQSVRKAGVKLAHASGTRAICPAGSARKTLKNKEIAYGDLTAADATPTMRIPSYG